MGDNAPEHREIAGRLFDFHGLDVAKHACVEVAALSPFFSPRSRNRAADA